MLYFFYFTVSTLNLSKRAKMRIYVLSKRIYGTKRQENNLLLVSIPLAKGHLNLVTVDALVGGQQSIESHAQLHQMSVKIKNT